MSEDTTTTENTFTRFAPGNTLLGTDGVLRIVVASAFWRDDDPNLGEAIESLLLIRTDRGTPTYEIAEVPARRQLDATTAFDPSWVVLATWNICGVADTWSEISGADIAEPWTDERPTTRQTDTRRTAVDIVTHTHDGTAGTTEEG